jgi:acyl carrier protein
MVARPVVAPLRTIVEQPSRQTWNRLVGMYAGAVGRGRLDKVVLAREIEGETVLVAYVVPGSAAPTERELRRALSDRLPDYMVPARFVLLSSLPLTPTGKVDRRALPEPAAGAEDASVGIEKPRTRAEELVKGVWSQVLRSDHIALRENFFLIGGHSLKLTQVASRLEDLLGAEVSLRELFDHPTIESLAGQLEKRFPSLARPVVPASNPLNPLKTG